MKKSKWIIVMVCVLAGLLPVLANATATRLTSYNAVLSALKEGHRVSAVADNTKCIIVGKQDRRTGKDDSMDPDFSMLMGISFNSNFFLKYRDEGDKRDYLIAIATNTIAGAGKVEAPAIYRYKRIRIYDDNSAEVFASRTIINTNKSGSIQSFCHLSNGHDANGVSVFDYDAVS